MYLAHNEGKFVIAERFIRTLKSKIYKYMSSISENVHINQLDDIVNNYNNRYHSTLKTKPFDVKSSTYIDSSQEVNNKDPKFNIVYIVRISKHKNISAKDYVQSWSEEVSLITKVKNTIPWIYVISDLNGAEIFGTFYKKYLQKAIRKDLRVEKVIKKKGNKLYVKWKGYEFV